jgi:hypothetical protein
MTIVFPKNNLPEPAQPWAREVQKQLANVIASNNSNEINNATRDNQLNSSLISLSKVANDASSAINGLLGLSSPTSEYSVNASNISAGTITGSTVQTSTTTGVSLNNATNSISFRVGTTTVGHILPLSTFGILMHYGATPDPNGGTFPQIFVGSSNISFIISPTMALGLSASGVAATKFETNRIFCDGVSAPNGIAIGRGGLTVGLGNISASDGTISAAGNISTNGRVDSGGNMRSGGTLGRVELDGGGTTGASINNSGNLIRTASSERYKQDIGELVINYEDLLLLSPKKFRLKEEVIGSEEIEANKNARYYAGFIAEEIAETPLDIFVSYEKLEDGTSRPDGVYYAELSAALLAGIKHQDILIKSLTERITTLENGAK